MKEGVEGHELNRRNDCELRLAWGHQAEIDTNCPMLIKSETFHSSGGPI